MELLSLLDALTYENSIHRNPLVHCHEMVMARREWWDEKVFNDYPRWEDAVEDRVGYFGDRAAKNRSPVLTKLEEWFGKAPESGPGNYAQSRNYGIGRIVLAKMLNLNASEVEEALRSLPLTPRARQGLELKAQKEREERRVIVRPGIRGRSGSVADPLGRPLQFKSRPHKPRIGLEEREHTAIGGDEQIKVLVYIWIGGAAGAIRVDGIRAGGARVPRNLPVHAF